MRRLTLLLPAAVLALTLTACGGSTSPEPADGGAPTSGAPDTSTAPDSSAAPETSSAPEGDAGAPTGEAADLVLSGAVGGLTFEPSTEPVSGGPDLSQLGDQITIEPEECKSALTPEVLAQGEEDLESGRSALSVATGESEIVVALVSETVGGVEEARERLDTCGELTMDVGMGEPLQVTITETDVPEAEGATDTLGLVVSTALPGQTVTSTQYMATVRERQVVLNGSSIPGGDGSTDSLDAAYTAQVEKIVAAS
ncbi:DUF5642 family protein [Auraticoccus monumenti]|uniref:PknH-like extracellular domain-containing protein n=1 Tax=Auraticoccus monumenti TaxID=675864 RepID=A0A1G6SMC5_9ACTN|nr:DUF5642 family protein [Auraticoccus monumenti]SDD18009.1 hypothetical protein SAMN04489747_0370 [Auraticoccus monumenti]